VHPTMTGYLLRRQVWSMSMLDAPRSARPGTDRHAHLQVGAHHRGLEGEGRGSPAARRWTIRLHEKGGKQHSMPYHHAPAEVLRAYIDAAGIVEDRKGLVVPHITRA
jgi:hypothetical protein